LQKFLIKTNSGNQFSPSKTKGTNFQDHLNCYSTAFIISWQGYQSLPKIKVNEYNLLTEAQIKLQLWHHSLISMEVAWLEDPSKDRKIETEADT